MLLDLFFAAAILSAAFVVPQSPEGAFRHVERQLKRLVSRRLMSIAAIFVLAVVLRVAVMPVEPVPAPSVHDEFSYLLLADTFAHGRLTNPSPALSQHFETFHENMKPTYCSKFFPAQGLFLAIGELVFGNPFYGVVFSLGLFAAATCWAMQGWMPPGWAFLGAFVLIIHFAVFGYWANSYWGGSVAALGGTLVIGALPRIKRTLGVRDSIFMAIGFGVLANSRPYEGLVFSIPVVIILVLHFVRERLPVSTMLKVIIPIGAVIACVMGWMCYYFWRTTGHPFTPPYAVYSARYDSVPFVPWHRLQSNPHYDNAVMQTFYSGFVRDQYHLYRQTPFAVLVVRLFSLWSFFLGPVLTVPLLAVCWLLPYGMKFKEFPPKTRELLIITACGFLAVLPIVFFEAHYAAPVTCSLYILLLYCIRRVWLWKRGDQATGKMIIRGVVLACILILALRVTATRLRISPLWLDNGNLQSAEQIERPQVFAFLQKQAGRQLVIVRYSENHNPHEEWVYNRADIDDAKVVWARELDSPSNQRLIEHFKDRQVWLLEPDRIPVGLENYSLPPSHPGTQPSMAATGITPR